MMDQLHGKVESLRDQLRGRPSATELRFRYKDILLTVENRLDCESEKSRIEAQFLSKRYDQLYRQRQSSYPQLQVLETEVGYLESSLSSMGQRVNRICRAVGVSQLTAGEQQQK